MSLTDALADLAVDAPRHLPHLVYAEWVTVDGPVGPLCVAITDRGVCHVWPTSDPTEFADAFHRRFGRPLRAARRPPAGLTAALRTGRPGRLEFDLRGLTDFERAVLRQTAQIPAGETRPYAWVAAEIGRPGAVRATGTALGHNPVPVLIPCHRVVRSDGAPGDYAFGPAMKARLLAHERAVTDAGFVASGSTGIVCYPSCHDARRITPAHRVPFRRLGDALAAGYRPCQHCRPH